MPIGDVNRPGCVGTETTSRKKSQSVETTLPCDLRVGQEQCWFDDALNCKNRNAKE